MNSRINHLNYRPDIDGLRALAVLAVVAFHAYPNIFSGGFIGVDIFFVISGYLISNIIFSSLEQGTFSFNRFYEKRILRIFPALLVVLISSYLFGWFYLQADEYKELGKNLAAGTTFISNLVSWADAGYFDSSAETKPLLHLWSLGIEEQFYIIWPLLLWIGYKAKIKPLTITILCAITSFSFNLYTAPIDIVADFYSPLTRFWELMIGGVLAWLLFYQPTTFGLNSARQKHVNNPIVNTPQFSKTSNTLSILGMLLILLGIGILSKNSIFPGYLALIPVMGTVLIITAGQRAWINYKLLSNKVAVWIGLISFPLYLWHWPILSFARIIEGDIPSRYVRLFLLLLSVFLAWLTYKFIEQPIRHSKRNSRTSLFLIAAMLIMLLTGYHSFQNEGIPERNFVKQHQIFTYSEDVPGYINCNFHPTMEKVFPKTIKLNYCMVPATQNPTAAIIGDSHAEDKFHGLVEKDKANKWILLGNSNCPPTMGVTILGEQSHCRDQFQSIYEYLESNKDIHEVLISFYGIYLKKNNYQINNLKLDFTMPNDQGFNDKWQEIIFTSLDNSIKKLLNSGKKVTLIIDVPELPNLPRDCLRNPLKKCELPLDQALETQADFRKMAIHLKKKNPTLIIYDPINLICNDTQCTFKKNQTILYRDSHHLSLDGSNIFAEGYLLSRENRKSDE